MLMVAGVQVTADHRPILIAAALHEDDSDAPPICCFRAYVRPSGWQVNADPKSERLCAQRGLPLTHIIKCLRYMSACAEVFATGDMQKFVDLMAWARGALNIKEPVLHESVKTVELKMDTDDIALLKQEYYTRKNAGLLT